MNSKSVAKFAACASKALLLWVSLTSFTGRDSVGTLSELNQIEYDKHLLPSNSISAGCGYSWLSNDILTANGESLGRTPTVESVESAERLPPSFLYGLLHQCCGQQNQGENP